MVAIKIKLTLLLGILLFSLPSCSDGQRNYLPGKWECLKETVEIFNKESDTLFLKSEWHFTADSVTYFIKDKKTFQQPYSIIQDTLIIGPYEFGQKWLIKKLDEKKISS